VSKRCQSKVMTYRCGRGVAGGRALERELENRRKADDSEAYRPLRRSWFVRDKAMRKELLAALLLPALSRARAQGANSSASTISASFNSPGSFTPRATTAGCRGIGSDSQTKRDKAGSSFALMRTVPLRQFLQAKNSAKKSAGVLERSALYPFPTRP